jgi:hypothetical protein
MAGEYNWYDFRSIVSLHSVTGVTKPIGGLEVVPSDDERQIMTWKLTAIMLAFALITPSIANAASRQRLHAGSRTAAAASFQSHWNNSY